MKKKIIYIIIESVKRELNSKTLFALKAQKKNYRVLIGQKERSESSKRHKSWNNDPKVLA